MGDTVDFYKVEKEQYFAFIEWLNINHKYWYFEPQYVAGRMVLKLDGEGIIGWRQVEYEDAFYIREDFHKRFAN
jgi:hypothetical protein